MVNTSSEDETSVKIFLFGEVLFRGNVYPEGSFLDLHKGTLQSVCPPEWLQSFWFKVKLPKSCWSCGRVNLLQTHTWGLFIWIFSTETSGELEIWLSHPSLGKRGNGFHFPDGSKCIELAGTHHMTTRLRVFCWHCVGYSSLTSDKLHIGSESLLQLLYFRHRWPLSLHIMRVGQFYEGENILLHTSTPSEEDVENCLKTLHRLAIIRTVSEIYVLNLRIKNCMRDVTRAHICVLIFWRVSVATSCEVSHCGYKQMFTIKDGRASISSKAKVWSALGDSYYCTFDGGDFALQGNCNYTLVQTTCAGLNTSIPLKSNIVRAYLNSATVSTIHLVQMEFRVSHRLG